ncbi:DUF998 domain-containing protein [Alkalihalobacillus pseudalcaliphilus]|uniref:DUF998 domain-containing protein n=1 Tax=Alkalihalobacillus pseudalcaliphilus TaxID=79884 RepID=UPI00064DA56A|nr:DUF998 domain-containing protein [Alkalihalobacillus pseudalcaliphilus]KMK76822.1 hypothetical protein AB990_07910 [Alkalihalobacillus pseudalcaliphilus]
MRISNTVGIASWILTCFYFILEPFFIWSSTVPYYFMEQAMSDLGVTACGENTYALGIHEICSPYHFWMNLLFIFNGITLALGVLYIFQFLERTWQTVLATIFIVMLAIGNIFSGIFPADVDLFWHSLFVVIGMVTLFPGMWIYARFLSIGKKWTYLCLGLLVLVFLLIISIIFVPMPNGLLQRLFYLIVFVWGTVLAWRLSRTTPTQQS